MTTSRTEFTIDNMRYSPGDQIPIVVNANNTTCNNSIKNFKFKIWRRIRYNIDNQVVETAEYMSNIKIPGCKPKEAVRREHSILLPLVESDGKTVMTGTSGSVNYSVEYKLRCFVKHSSVFEIGQGHCVEFPLHILHRPDDTLATVPFDK